MDQLGDQHPESTNRKSPSIDYLLAEGFFAAGAALSFIAAYSFWVQVQTRPGNPSSEMPLFAPGVGCTAFLYGLVDLLWRDRLEPVMDRKTTWCLLIGLGATLTGFLWPGLWR
ncbi:MAG TPA: hypothetical protein PKG54_19565 [Phycisphaerae bacterium]|jgi:hypothetical protein|nr:hypothetical protein [Phycisphaerae bacterium]HOB76715.1 hypothetical protein [Phycisphaerae bacterium]HOJ56603.1 hypothetical protein [Phycisphaerae bacterium]HOL28432.1 hypothetical protein [Phycisphaerae bacterium]HPP19926.1 hypothetical protein [Phycisphaerae bacterium]